MRNSFERKDGSWLPLKIFWTLILVDFPVDMHGERRSNWHTKHCKNYVKMQQLDVSYNRVTSSIFTSPTIRRDSLRIKWIAQPHSTAIHSIWMAERKLTQRGRLNKRPILLGNYDCINFLIFMYPLFRLLRSTGQCKSRSSVVC